VLTADKSGFDRNGTPLGRGAPGAGHVAAADRRGHAVLTYLRSTDR
jgi:hypothetical protein